MLALLVSLPHFLRLGSGQEVRLGRPLLELLFALEVLSGILRSLNIEVASVLQILLDVTSEHFCVLLSVDIKTL